MPDFAFRALEVHSVYAWDFRWIRQALSFMRGQGLNALVLHRNDIVDQMVYPAKFFGGSDAARNIFERYQEIHRALYRYTPTRRSGPYLRRDYLKRVIDLAARDGIAVWFENKELTFHDIFLELNPQLVKDGHLCPNEPFWWAFVARKYTELFQDLPGLAGIITAPGTGESRLAISSNRCQCALCRATTPTQWYVKLIMAMHAPIRAAGRELAVRDFVFDRRAHEELAAAMEKLPSDIIISLKNTPHDYYPTFPDNPRLGKVGPHRQWLEYDCMGQYFGWGVAPAIMIEDMRGRLERGAAQGVEGMILRTDWESLDGHTAFDTPNRINLHSGAALLRNIATPARDIFRAWLEETGQLKAEASEAARDEAAGWAERLLGGSWDITRRALFANDCVFSDATLYPVSLAHAWWLAEEKNSLQDWLPEKAGALSSEPENLARLLAEKDAAVLGAEALLAVVEAPPAGLAPAAVTDLRARIDIFIRYVRGFRAIGHALFLVRASLDGRGIDPDTLQSALDALLAEADSMQAFAEASDFAHVVYTLLSPERLRALHLDLVRRLEQGA